MKKLLLFSMVICAAACSPVKKSNADCVSEAKEGCECTTQYDPVCGCNNITYSNTCAASCAGIKSMTKGPCPEKN